MASKSTPPTTINFQFPNGFSLFNQDVVERFKYADFQFPNGFSHYV